MSTDEGIPISEALKSGAEYPVPSTVAIERLVLQWERYAQSMVVSGEMLNDVRFDAYAEHAFDRLRLVLTKNLLTDTFASDQYDAELLTPATPWQHWKHDHRRGRWFWPGWAVRRWPVRMQQHVVTVSVDRMHTYPEARVQLPEFGRPVVIERVRGPWWQG